jgi:hypothetical protein
MRLAKCKVHSPLTVLITTPVSVTSCNGITAARVWFHTNPLSGSKISGIYGMKLTMVSNHSEVNCWFEIAIYNPKKSEQSRTNTIRNVPDVVDPKFILGNRIFELKYSSDGVRLSWPWQRWSCRLAEPSDCDWGRRIGLSRAKEHRCNGSFFEEDSEIWSHLSPGDCIAVLAFCKVDGIHTCTRKRALLKFWEYFDPQTS